MRTSDFDYELPPTSIAQHPEPRGASRLLDLSDPAGCRHRRVRDLPELLGAGDLLVVNNTRVFPARLVGRRSSGARQEVLLVRRLDHHRWEVLLRPARRARPGTSITFSTDLQAEVVTGVEGGRCCLRFTEPVEPHLGQLGSVPLPPYIKRSPTARDEGQYQTVYARHPGAVAAPTAGLHFTQEMLDRLAERGVQLCEITLHVGPGTFRPVTADDPRQHTLDSERAVVTEAAAESLTRARDEERRIVAVGTTVVRTLEALALRGGGQIEAWEGEVDLFILPGFHFQCVDLLLTNFHLPRSTLLMLVSAFTGRERLFTAYGEAIAKGYRFYSYGDAMLVGPTGSPETP